MAKKPLKKLNLGCGADFKEDCDNHDIIEQDGLKYCFDLENKEWPITEKYDYIYLLDVVEHIQPKYFFRIFDNCHDILNEGGKINVRVPSEHSGNTWTDPTHYRGYKKQSFEYLDPDTFWGKNYGFYTSKKFKLIEVAQNGNELQVILKRR